MAAPDILIIDDTPDNLRLMCDLLQANGLTARGLPNAGMALASLGRRVPDLILVDRQMPGMDGLQVCQNLKASKSFRHIPILVVSTFDDDRDVIAAYRAGADDYLRKPLVAEEFLARVGTQLKLTQLLRQAA